MGDGHLELVWSRARGGPEGALLALMDAAETEPDAAEGLAAAYASLTVRDRARLVETIVADGRAAGRSVAETLALLLGAESEPELARTIAAGLDGTVARPEFDVGWCWGSLEAGGTLITRHLHGRFVEVLRVRWDGDRLEAEGERLARFEAHALRRRYGVPAEAARGPLQPSVDRMATAVWTARRRGAAMPDVLRAFAHVFTVD